MKPIFKKQNSKFTPYWNYSIEEEYKNSMNRIEKHLSISLEEHIQRAIDFAKLYFVTPNIDQIRENQSNHYLRQQQLSTASLVEYYNAFLCNVCSVTGEKIPYDTDYYIQVIQEDENDPEYLLYSLEGMKVMQNEIDEIINAL